jgi:hypothetical protein
MRLAAQEPTSDDTLVGGFFVCISEHLRVFLFSAMFKLMKKIFFLLVLPLLLNAGSNPKSAVAVRTAVAPMIDGVMNEPAWQLAKPVTDFTQRDPNEGEPASERTEIRILYDNEALYFGCLMYDSDPSKIVARLARRDDEVESDVLSIRIDSYHDHQTAFEFTILASGVKVDILQYNDAQQEDASWDPVWEVQTRITDDGWVAEVKIPFNILRFTPRPEMEWGIQFIRRISRKQERDQWVLIRKSESGFVSKFGHLVGLRDLPAPSNLELIPYAVGSNRFLPPSAAYPNGRDYRGNAGFDVKYRPGWLTVDATINPDFGQVEADPAVLNLSTFETFYPERRPFFIEGVQIFRFGTFGDGGGGPGLFYSRRIGRALEVDPPANGYLVDEPRAATILGAAKISGKTAGGLSVGLLEAVTGEERATVVDTTGRRTEMRVEPLTSYSVFRLRQDVLENSNLGMIATSVHRRGGWPALTGGVDWTLRFLESTYRLDGFLAVTRTTNSLNERLNGSAGRISFNKDGGEHWRGFLSADFTSKTYNVNDIGYFRRPNDYGMLAQVVYRDDYVTDWERFWNVQVLYHYRKNYDGAELFNSFQIEGAVRLLNYWEFNLRAEVDQGKYDDRETRGFGLYQKRQRRSMTVRVESDPRELIVGDARASFGGFVGGGRFASVNTELEFKPWSHFTLQCELTHSRRDREFAWVANTTLDGLAELSTATIFADRTTREWDLTFRGSFVFSRDLTLQYYAQVFFAKGTFTNYAIMVGPDAFVPTSAYQRSDFNKQSFHSNLVLRWEFLPGSTAYLVWSQARSGDEGSYSTPLSEDWRRTFSLPMENVVLLKVSYWWSL